MSTSSNQTKPFYKPTKRTPSQSGTLVAQRQERVAFYALRNYSPREILDLLTEDGFLAEDGVSPYKITTIRRDLTNLRKRWRKNADEDISQLRADQFAILQQVQKEAWQRSDLVLVLKSHDRIERLLGTARPSKIEHEMKGVSFVLPEALAGAMRGEAPQTPEDEDENESE